MYLEIMLLTELISARERSQLAYYTKVEPGHACYTDHKLG